MLLRYSFDMAEDADLIEKAIDNVLSSGLRTADIMQPNKARVSTGVMTDSILKELDKLVAGRGPPRFPAVPIWRKKRAAEAAGGRCGRAAREETRTWATRLPSSEAPVRPDARCCTT